jgi:hypothetical protein
MLVGRGWKYHYCIVVIIMKSDPDVTSMNKNSRNVVVGTDVISTTTTAMLAGGILRLCL